MKQKPIDLLDLGPGVDIEVARMDDAGSPALSYWVVYDSS